MWQPMWQGNKKHTQSSRPMESICQCTNVQLRVDYNTGGPPECSAGECYNKKHTKSVSVNDTLWAATNCYIACFYFDSPPPPAPTMWIWVASTGTTAVEYIFLLLLHNAQALQCHPDCWGNCFHNINTTPPPPPPSQHKAWQHTFIARLVGDRGGEFWSNKITVHRSDFLPNALAVETLLILLGSDTRKSQWTWTLQVLS